MRHYKLHSRQNEQLPRKLLVHIHAFCLMPNHYHLLLSPAIENGIALFMKKLGMGYAKYFNERYGRSGALWQGKYKRIRIARDAHFLYIPYYIHLNPLDLSHAEWRHGKVKNVWKALEYLKAYRWSSYLDYQRTRNFPSITDREFLAPLLGSSREQEKQIAYIITDLDLSQQGLLLE